MFDLRLIFDVHIYNNEELAFVGGFFFSAFGRCGSDFEKSLRKI
jgi:hypothetical protein